MTNLKLNTPVILNEKEICECCDNQAVYSYLAFGNSGSPAELCEPCLKDFLQSDQEILEEKLKEIEENKQRDTIFELMVSVREEVQELLNNNCESFDKIQSSMSSSIYFEFEVDGVDKKIRISDHDARHTYNILNGQADYEVAVGYESAEANFIIKSEEDIKILIEKLAKKFF